MASVPATRSRESFRLLVLCEEALTESRVGDRLEHCLPEGAHLVEFAARHLRTRAARARLASCLGGQGVRVALMRRLERLSARDRGLAANWLSSRASAADWIVLTAHVPRAVPGAREAALQAARTLGIHAVLELDAAPAL